MAKIYLKRVYKDDCVGCYSRYNQKMCYNKLNIDKLGRYKCIEENFIYAEVKRVD